VDKYKLALDKKPLCETHPCLYIGKIANVFVMGVSRELAVLMAFFFFYS